MNWFMIFGILLYVLTTAFSVYITRVAIKTLNQSLFGKYELQGDDTYYVLLFTFISFVPIANLLNIWQALSVLSRARKRINSNADR